LTATLAPLADVLARGNEAMVWLARHRNGESVATIVAGEAAALAEREQALEAWLATDTSHALG
jgi:hypothetical protein